MKPHTRPRKAAVILSALAAAASGVFLPAVGWAQGACDGGWFALAGGMSSVVLSLAALPGGGLVAGGSFTTADGVGVDHIARWDGSGWSPLGTGTNGDVNALAILPGGDVIAGGSFTAAGGAPASRIARWNGSAWSPLGSGLNDWVNALAVLPNGDLVAGGPFVMAGGGAASAVARWDGSAWSPLGTGLNTTVRALAVLPNGDLVAAGDFVAAGGAPANRIARWDGAAWFPLGGGLNNAVYALTVLPGGDVVAGGGFSSAGGSPAKNIARWDGSAWFALGQGANSLVSALTVLPVGGGSALIAGGYFSSAGGVAASKVASWDGAGWSPLGTGVANAVDALAVLSNGDLAAGGFFTSAGTLSARRIARWTPMPILPPAVTVQPAPSTVCSGGSAVYFVTSDGTAPLTYRWQVESLPQGSNSWGDLFDGPFFNGAATAGGAFTSMLTISNAQPAAAVRYRCRVSNSCATVSSDPAALAVVTPAIITGHPVAQSACAGGSAAFAITVGEASSLAYRWQIEAAPSGSGVWADLADGPINGGAALASGSATASLAISNVQPEIAARYRCRISHECGAFDSGAAGLTVLSAASADFNHSGTTTLQDMFDFLTAWFAGLASADFNGSGVVTVQDVFDFLLSWFARC